ncbi:hypothetical protein LSP03_33390 [Lysinibacillus sphaericus]|nr:hypothetical protein LSP03_33390 [Lysinibacillus sphaericus]
MLAMVKKSFITKPVTAIQDFPVQFIFLRILNKEKEASQTLDFKRFEALLVSMKL